MVPETEEKIDRKIDPYTNEVSNPSSAVFYNATGNPYCFRWNGKDFSLIEATRSRRLSIKEKEKLLSDLNERGYVIPDGSLPFHNVPSIVSDLLSIYNLDSKDKNKKARADMAYDRWRNEYNYYRNGLEYLKKRGVSPNCFYYIQFKKAKIFVNFLLTKGLNLAGTVNSVKKAGRHKIEAVESKEKTVEKITEPYIESLSWKTEIFTRLASSIVVGGAVIITAQQEAIQKLAEYLPGLGHLGYVLSAILTVGFFSFSKHVLRYIALSARNKSHTKVINEVAKADRAETESGENKAAIFRLSVMEMMADLGYWKELMDVVHEVQEPVLFNAVINKKSMLFSIEIAKAKDILLNEIKWYQFRRKILCASAKIVAELASNSAKEMNGTGLTSSEASYYATVRRAQREAGNEV